jgi:HK97 family phage portal protein
MMLGRLLNNATEERAITYQSLFLSDQTFSQSSLAGVAMNQTAAMKIGVVYSAVRLIADTISTLPLDVFYRQNGERLPFRPKPEWVDYPEADPTVGRSDFYQTIIISVLLAGNSYTRVLRDTDGTVLALANLDPTRVAPRRNNRGFIEFVFDNRIVIAGEDMIHITDMRKAGEIKGESRVDQLKDVLGISRALDEWSARYFGQGTVSSGIIAYPGEMTAEQADRLKEQFEKNSRGMRNAHRPNILTGGAKYERMSDDASQAQLVEAKKFAVEEVARVFKIQPSMLGSQVPGARAYASQEQDAIQFVTLTLRPLIFKLEEAFNRLLRPVSPSAFLRWNMEGLLRGDIQSRYAAYSQGTQAGFLSINDIHRLEDMLPVDGGDVYRVPLSHVDLDAANIVEQDKRISMAVRLINVGFDPADVLSSLDLPAMEHTGLPSVQLQNAAQHTEADVDDVYPGSRDLDEDTEERDIAGDIATALSASIRAMPAPVVNVNMPEPSARSKRVERDDEGNITAIVEE